MMLLLQQLQQNHPRYIVSMIFNNTIIKNAQNSESMHGYTDSFDIKSL